VSKNPSTILIKKEVEALQIIKHASRKYKLAVSFSGGKDSLVVLDLAERLGINIAVFVDTTIEFDETIEYVNRMKDLFSSKIHVIKPEIDFFDLIDKINFPSRRFRWCCDVIKNAPLGKFARNANLDGFITGLRRNESFRRENYEYFDTNPIFGFKQINPILDWVETDVFDYIKKYNLELNPLYDYFNRVGCWMCPYKGEKEWNLINKIKPEKVKELEIRLKNIGERLHIKDINWFVKERGWTYYVFQTKKHTSGLITPCSINDTVIFRGQTEDQIERIKLLLPIISKSFKSYNRILRINIEKKNIRKLNILIEKALNCVGCGTCMAICPSGALEYLKGKLTVDMSKCNNCLQCLDTTRLRGACIMRNYNPQRNSVENGSNVDPL